MVDKVTNAIADPIRRRILEILATEEASAGQISEAFDVSRPAVSRHLRVLRESGLIDSTLRGRKRLYRLNTAPLKELSAWIAGLDAPITEPMLDALDLEVRRTKRESNSPTVRGASA